MELLGNLSQGLKLNKKRIAIEPINLNIEHVTMVQYKKENYLLCTIPASSVPGLDLGEGIVYLSLIMKFNNLKGDAVDIYRRLYVSYNFAKQGHQDILDNFKTIIKSITN